jgi:uncharacterized protein
MFYVDSSVFVALLTAEARQRDVEAWLERQPENTLSVSPWVRTEIASALAIKVRTGNLTRDNRTTALILYGKIVASSLDMVQVEELHFETAARYIDNVELALRGGDALHLAVASHYGLTLATLDKRLAEAGAQLGAATLLL